MSLDSLEIDEKFILRNDKSEIILVINQYLIDELDISDEILFAIKDLHLAKYRIKDNMEILSPEKDKKKLRKMEQAIKNIRFALQHLWGFPINENYHRFWNVPHCTCPTMDNEDRYGHESCVVSADCIYHGVEALKEKNNG